MSPRKPGWDPKQHADPGGEHPTLPEDFGTQRWAERVRLSWQAVAKNIAFEPEQFVRYLEMVVRERAWEKMNRPDGSFMASLRELFEVRYPWGLGVTLDKVRPFVEAVVGRRSAGLLLTAKAAPPRAGPGRGRKTIPRDGGLFSPPTPARKPRRSHTTAERARAILRAPAAVRALYEAGLLGMELAAKLGPLKPTPEVRARNERIAAAVAGMRDRRQVEATIRDMLGERSRRAERWIAAYGRMTSEEQRRIREAILDP